MADTKNLLIIKTITQMREWCRNTQGSVGFIPTMGYLHDGHISLVNLAKAENDHVVVSIFVNPKQFGPQDDFSKYPREVNHDLELLQKARVSVAFLPEASEMYPKDFETSISVTNMSKKLEGKSRPGHFDGVATVVAKLFNIIQPTRAYFGQKDAQQVVIIKRMVSDLHFPIKIIVGNTIRESNGLALSSRNIFLSKKEKEESAVLSSSLSFAQKLFKQGERDPKKIKDAIQQLIKKTTGRIDYISVADPTSLDELEIIHSKALVSLAVYYGRTRLIDNCILTL